MLKVLKQLEEKVAFVKQPFQIALVGGDPKDLEGAVAGVWGIHKSLRGGGWSITHIPTGRLLASHLKTQGEAKAIVNGMIEQIPSLMDATNINVFRQYQDAITKIIKYPPGTKKARKLDFDDIEKILSDAGLENLGRRSGKAGVMWGIRGLSRQIAVGNRDVMRNVFLAEVDDDYSYRKPGTRWTNEEIESQGKMKEPRLRGWAKWAKQGMTTKQVLTKVRQEYDRMEPDDRGRKYAHVTGREKLHEGMELLLARLEESYGGF